MGFLERYLKSKLHGHIDYESWRPEEKLKYLRYIPKDVSTILDVGCGLGELLWILKKEGYNIEGCDTDKVCIKRSKKIISEVKYADTQKLSQYYPFGSFDLIICTHVLEHTRYPYIALKEMKTVTKKYILLAVPNAQYIAHDELDTHLYSWNRSTLRNILEDLDLQIMIISKGWMNMWPNFLRISPILGRILLRIFWDPMELIALTRVRDRSIY